MPTADADLLEGIADAVAGAPTEADAIVTLQRAGGAAAALVAKPAEAGSLLSTLIAASAFAGSDLRLAKAVAAELPSKAATVAVLRAIAARVDARRSRWGAIIDALASPLLLVALGIALEPLPDLVVGGAYARPVIIGLGELVIVTAAVAWAVPTMLGHALIGPALLHALTHVPLIGRLARKHAEVELTTVLGAFSSDVETDETGLRTARVVASFGPLRFALNEKRPNLPSIATRASDSLRLLLLTAPGAGVLAQRLTKWSARAADELTRTLARTLRTLAWLALFAMSTRMLVKAASGGLGGLKLPTGGGLPLQNAEQEELDKILREGR